MDFNKIKEAIDSYSKEDFHIKMVRGVGLKKNADIYAMISNILHRKKRILYAKHL